MQNFESISLTTLAIFLINRNVTAQTIEILKIFNNGIIIMSKTKSVNDIKVYWHFKRFLRKDCLTENVNIDFLYFLIWHSNFWLYAEHWALLRPIYKTLIVPKCKSFFWETWVKPNILITIVDSALQNDKLKCLIWSKMAFQVIDWNVPNYQKSTLDEINAYFLDPVNSMHC